MPGVSVILTALLVFAVLGVSVTIWLVRRSWKRRRTAPIAERVAVSIVAAAAVFGGLSALLGVVAGFGAVGGESVDPSQKARILAEGIAQTMNSVAFSLFVWLPSLIVALVVTRGGKDRTP